MAIHSDPGFYTDEILRGMSERQLDDTILGVERARDDATRDQAERDAWNEVLSRAVDERARRPSDN